MSSNNLNLYRSMLRIRLVEEAIVDRYPEQDMRCPVHLSIGQEAVAVGTCSALQSDDVDHVVLTSSRECDFSARSS